MSRHLPALCLVLLGSLICQEGEARSRRLPLFLQTEGHLSLLSGSSDRSMLGDTLGYALRGGYRLDERWGAFVQVEQNLWFSNELSRDLQNGALNVGIGAEMMHFDGRARTSVALGPSILLFDTFFSESGTAGMFIDLRFFGIRWELTRWLKLVLDPLCVTWVGPDLGKIPISLLQYRTVVGLEVSP